MADDKTKDVDMTDAGRANDKEDHTDARGQTGFPIMNESDFISAQYKMDYPSRGVAVIINNKTFHDKTRMNPVEGSDADANAMFQLLDSLGFEKQLHQDLQAKEIKSVLGEVARMNHTHNSCFVCVILTRGDEGYVFATDGKIPVDELIQPFKGDVCQSLAGKPKLFFIQAWRSTKPKAVRESCMGGEINMDVIRRIPVEADILMTYATIPENPRYGLWFIRTFVDVCKHNWQTMDLLTMITRTNKRVAREFETLAKDEFVIHNKQIPCVTSMLTKDVYF